MNENVNVCITPKGEKPILHFSQFDNGRIFTVTVLADDGESAAVLTDLDIEFRLRKTDSHVVTVAPESVTDNVITFKTTEQMCACCGQNIASVVFMQDDDIISSLDILVDIQRDILSGGLTSESDIRNLTTQIEQIVPEVIGDDYYTKTEVDELIADIPTFDPSNYYDKSDVDGLLADKADADDVYTKTDVDGLLDDKLDNIVQHVLSGTFPIATFNTDCVAPMQSITAEIVAVQSGTGTPSPSNPRPISGFSALNVTRTGKNLFNKQSGMQYIPLKSGTKIYGKIFGFSGQFNLYGVKPNNDPSVVSNWTTLFTLSSSEVRSYTLTEDFDYIGISSGAYSDLGDGNVQVSLSNFDTFEPYNGQTAAVNFGQSVYGGVADVTNGKVTITHGIVVCNGSEAWTEYAQGKYYANDVISRNSNKVDDNLNNICNIYSFVGNGGTGSGTITTDNSVYLTASFGRVWIYDSTISSVSDLQTALSNTNLQLVYELATPIEISTTPETLSAIVGVNNVWSDTGDIKELSYFEHVDSALIALIKACMI